MDVSLEVSGITGIHLHSGSISSERQMEDFNRAETKGHLRLWSVHQSVLTPARKVGLFRGTQTRNAPAEVHAPGVPQH